MARRGELEHQVLEALGWPCEVCAQVVRLLITHPHDRHAFARAAAVLGFRNRQALSRRMQKHGFPAPRRLQDWLRVLVIIAIGEQTSLSLQTQAFEHGVDPTTLHRAIARISSARWKILRAEGVKPLLGRLADAVGEQIRCRQR